MDEMDLLKNAEASVGVGFGLEGTYPVIYAGGKCAVAQS
jgi:hypothetical protein